MGGLSPGKYLVSVTTPASNIRISNRYEIKDSNDITLLSNNQSYADPDYHYGDVDWRDLSDTVSINDHTLVVGVSAVSKSFVAYIDAVSVQRMRHNAPEIRVTEAANKLNILSGVSEVDFGLTAFGESSVRDFEIENLGDVDLILNLNETATNLPYRSDSETGAVLNRLGHVSVPVGYQASFIGGQRVAPG
ncbi:MAG: hypothetical protein GY880_22755, partial [Planctomycetaceae bacterium]|nr:hypothetical protein [Planctomycetaceae bacterium]